MMYRSTIFAAAMLLPLAAAAQDWLAPLKPADQERITNMEASRNKALARSAFAKAPDIRIVRQLIDPPAQPLNEAALPGKWRCRSLELDGIIGVTVNPFFECRIVLEGGALWFEKLTGGTRRKARLAPIDETRLLFYGAYRAADEKQQPYGADDYHDEVGVLERVSADRLRVELPEPRAYNSAGHEFFELVRLR